MANKYTEAQKRASLNYQKGMAQVKITVSKEQRDQFKRLAERQGVTLTQLVLRLLHQELRNQEQSDIDADPMLKRLQEAEKERLRAETLGNIQAARRMREKRKAENDTE